MRVAYTPPVDCNLMRQWRCPDPTIKAIQAKSDAFYAGIETEIVLEDKGYILKMYVQGQHVGGLQQI